MSAPYSQASTSTSGSQDIPPLLLPIIGFLTSILQSLTTFVHRIPGSPILLRYIRSSYQNDPWRSLLEVLLVAFALRTLLSRRTRGEGEGKGLKLSEKVCPWLVQRKSLQPAPFIRRC